MCVCVCLHLCFCMMCKLTFGSFQTPETNIALLARDRISLQKEFQQICDALSEEVRSDCKDFSCKES